MRSYERTVETPRPIAFELDFTCHADGSVLVSFGQTKVICTAFLEEKVPAWMRNTRKGWITAEYGMLPGSTHSRSSREAAQGKQSGRTVEITRLIGRALRTCVNLELLDERMITVDCDVIQADGGTRTASITGGCLALVLALWRRRDLFATCPVQGLAAAISLGVVDGDVLVDLDYSEDHRADVDLNLVMDHRSRLIEIQGTAEGVPFEEETLNLILKRGRAALAQVTERQRQALRAYGVEPSWVP